MRFEGTRLRINAIIGTLVNIFLLNLPGSVFRNRFSRRRINGLNRENERGSVFRNGSLFVWQGYSRKERDFFPPSLPLFYVSHLDKLKVEVGKDLWNFSFHLFSLETREFFPLTHPRPKTRWRSGKYFWSPVNFSVSFTLFSRGRKGLGQ